MLGQKGNGLDDMPDLGSVPLCYAEDDETVYLYKIPALVKMIQYQINVAIKNKISSPQGLINYHNQFTKEIKTKELCLLDEELSEELKIPAKLAKAGFPNARIKTREELEELIENGDDILFLHAIMPYEEKTVAKLWLMVISAKDGKVYSVQQNTVKNTSNKGLGLKDLQGLNN